MPNTKTLAGSQRLIGTVVSARGAVVDVRFGTGMLPDIDTAVNAEWGRPELLALVVPSHVDPAAVRGIALQTTAGLARGTQDVLLILDPARAGNFNAYLAPTVARKPKAR